MPPQRDWGLPPSDENWRGEIDANAPAVIAASSQPAVQLVEWKPYRSGPLRGFVSVVFGRVMRVNGISVMAGDNGPWLGMPSKPMLVRGQPVSDAKGRPRYLPLIEWVERSAERRFAAAVIAALLDVHPDAMEAR